MWLLRLGLSLGVVILLVASGHAGILDASWTAPTTNTNDSLLTDLAFYLVYYGTADPPCPGQSFFAVASPLLSPPAGETRNFRLTGLTTGTRYHVAITAVDTSGQESACSTSASAIARIDYAVTPTTAVDFGTVNIGNSAERVFTVSNTGSGTVSGTMSTSAPFSVLSGSPFSLGPGASQAVTVRFTPTTSATATVNVNVAADADSILRIVSGKGTDGTGNGTDTTPPTVAITSPTTNSTYSSVNASLTLRGTASDDVGVTQVTWANGRGGTGAATGTTNWTADGIILQPGTNVLTVRAQDAAGNSATASLTVIFTPNFVLAVSPTGAGAGTVTSTPDGIDCGATCAAAFPHDTLVALSATPAPGSLFSGWSGGGCSGTGTCVVTVSEATTVTATFTPQTFLLIVVPIGSGAGTVTSVPAGIDCGVPCAAALYAYDTVVTLTATPAVGSVFSGWSGGGCVGTDPCRVRVTAITVVRAIFGAFPPTLPVNRVDTAMPVTATTVTVCPSACDFSDLQTALDTVSLNTTIVLTAGLTYAGPFTLPNKRTGSGWILIQSSAMSNLPVPGNRVGPAHAPAMPRITANGVPPVAIRTAPGAHHYRLVGLEVSADTDAPGALLRLGDSGEPLLENQARQIIVDRSFVHGDGVHNVRRGVQFDVAQGAIVDSYLANFVDSLVNAQAVATTNAPGPLGVYNNYLEASGQNILLGGADPAIPNLIPSDIHIRGNYLSKPLRWLPQPWVVTNLVDAQNGQRVLIEENVLENSWAGSQIGDVFSLTSVNHDGTAPWSQTADVTIRYNLMRNASGAVAIAGKAGANPVTTPTARVAVHDNLILGMASQPGVRAPFQVGVRATDVIIDHNTVAASPGLGAPLLLYGGGTDTLTRFVFTNNIVAKGANGVTNVGPGDGQGTTALANAAPRAAFASNVIAGIDPSQYPVGNFGPSKEPTDDANVGYVDTAGGDFRLSASSPFHNAATDRTDIGADVGGVNAATKLVIAGSTLWPIVVMIDGSGSGAVSSSPTGINCPPTCSSRFPAGTVVTLTATPSANSVLLWWSDARCTGTGSCVVTMTAETAVTAAFALTYVLTVSRAGAGEGTVTSSPAGIACGGTCSASFPIGTAVTLTATPNANSAFTGWTGGGCNGTGGCTVNISGATTVTPTFTPIFALTVARAGTGTGTVTSSPAGIDCGASCTGSFLSGTAVTLTATPGPNSVFTGWTSGPCTGTGPCTVNVSTATAVTATFTPTVLLAISRAGQGAGTVSSSPTGINCGAICSASYASGTAVTLTATPGPNSAFTGWSGGACTGVGSCTVTLTAATAVTATFAFSPVVPAKRGDFNGDGKADLLWRHAQSGEVQVWLMNGAAITASGSPFTVPDPNWKIVGVGDFDGDGKADLFWRRDGSGDTYVWFMNGLAIAGAAPSFALADTNWKVEGVGDFDGDGKADLLWRHALSGEVYVWLMNGASIAASGSPFTVPDLNWKIVGVGDFDGDGKADVLWRHAVTGQTYVWFMNGLAIAGSAPSFEVADTNWKVQGVGDFDGNGKADVLWRHALSGEVYVWLMNGAAITASGSPFTVPDPDWKIVGVGDLDGDGKADVLWRHAVTGQVYVWLMNGLSISSSGSPASVPDLDWSVQNPK